MLNSKAIFKPYFFVLSLLVTLNLRAQIPFGSWRVHPDFSKAKGIEIVGSQVYGWSENGFFSYDLKEKESRLESKETSFSENYPSTLGFFRIKNENYLIAAYESGGIDIVKINETDIKKDFKTITAVKESSSIIGSKRINQIVAFGMNSVAFATDFGVLILDPASGETIDLFQLFEQNNLLAISQLNIFQNKIYVKTLFGVQEGEIASSVNLNDFNNWKKSDYKFPIQTNIISKKIENQTFEAIRNDGFYVLQNGVKTKISPPSIDQEIDFLASVQGKVVAKRGNQRWAFVNEIWQETQLDFQPNSLTDASGNKWTIAFGDVVATNPKTAQERRFASYNNVNIAGDAIALCFDRKGQLIIGTTNGVSIIENPTEVFDSKAIIYQPESGNRRLFFQERVQAIAVDPANRLWFGTPNGVYLLDENFNKVQSFNTTNSTLNNNNIQAIAVDDASGEVFFYDQKLLVSYRSDATTAAEVLGSEVIVAPNPVQPGFSGPVVVTNLPESTKVIFAELSGRELFETTSNGGTASWNLIDKYGREVGTGVYLVILIDETNNKKIINKLGVVR